MASKTISFIENAIAVCDTAAVKYISFDCFDTLVSRKCRNPSDVFMHLAIQLRSNNLLPTSVSIDRFREKRIQAEFDAREECFSKYGHREVNLSDIYNKFEFLVGVSTDDLVNKELQIERQMLFVNHTVLDLMDQLSSRCEAKFVLVSDTYLSTEQLRLVLPIELKDKIDFYYVSSEHGCGKYDKLFSKVIEDLGCHPSEYVHFGDNYHSDVSSAQKTDIKAALLPNGTAYSWSVVEREEVFQRFELCDPESLLSAGVLHLEALRHKVSHYGFLGSDCNHFSYGASVLGPIFFSLISRIRDYRTSQPNGITAVGLVREGRFIADLYNLSYSDQSIGEIGLSRYITKRAVLDPVTPEKLISIAMSRSTPSLDIFLESLGIEPTVRVDIANIMDVSLKGACPIDLLVQICKIICESSKTVAMIENYSRNLRRRIINHIELQIGKSLIDMANQQEPLILTDVGWGCTVQNDLSRILELENVDIQLKGFYLALNQRGDGACKSNSQTFGSMFDCESGSLAPRILRVLEIFEQSGTPPIGSIKDITDDGQVITALDGRPDKQLEEISEIQRGIMAYCNLAAKQFPNGSQCSEALGNYYKAIAMGYIYKPLNDEIDLFADWGHDDNLAGDKLEPLFRKDEDIMLPYYTLRQIDSISMTESYWPFANLRRNHRNYSDMYVACITGVFQFGGEVIRHAGPSTLHITDQDIDVEIEFNILGKACVRISNIDIIVAERESISIAFSDRLGIVNADWVELVSVNGRIFDNEIETNRDLNQNSAEMASSQRLNIILPNQHEFHIRSLQIGLKLQV